MVLVVEGIGTLYSMAVSKNQQSNFGSPHNEHHNVFGSILEPRRFWKPLYRYSRYRYFQAARCITPAIGMGILRPKVRLGGSSPPHRSYAVRDSEAPKAENQSDVPAALGCKSG